MRCFNSKNLYTREFLSVCSLIQAMQALWVHLILNSFSHRSNRYQWRNQMRLTEEISENSQICEDSLLWIITTSLKKRWNLSVLIQACSMMRDSKRISKGSSSVDMKHQWTLWWAELPCTPSTKIFMHLFFIFHLHSLFIYIWLDKCDEDEKSFWIMISFILHLAQSEGWW